MENKKLLIIRYFILVILLFSIISCNANINAYGIILILLYIINNNIRVFVFKYRKNIAFLSLILELGISFILYRNYGGYLNLYFLNNIIDGVILLDKNYSILSNGLTILTVALSFGDLSKGLIYSMSLLIVISLLTQYIKEQHISLLKSEETYYKLRISEDNLIKANRDLEIYADSIKELTTLRERNRISREIHDSVGHSLSTIIIQLGAIEKIAEENGQMASEMARNLNEFTKKSLEEIRIALRQLKPRRFEKYENIQAIEELIKEFTKFTGIEVNFKFTEEKWELNEVQALTIYRIVQEFLSNSLRHGKASKINIYMHYNEEELILTLKDNGQGVGKLEKGLGLTNIWERVEELNGQIEYNSNIGQGFLIRVVLRSMKELAF
ncbi:MAG: sensor histidine kinase [Tissierellia bacterium]|nr:sensor histidine kinase [Tissierellia bacterium]